MASRCTLASETYVMCHLSRVSATESFVLLTIGNSSTARSAAAAAVAAPGGTAGVQDFNRVMDARVVLLRLRAV